MKEKYKKYIKQYIIDRFQHPNYFAGEFKASGLGAIEDFKKNISFTENIDYTSYKNRKLQRYHIVGTLFKEYTGKRVLDVGSRTDTLEKVLGKKCELVDKNNPELPEFNWEIEKLPYPENTFDTVVCLDVLEHIDDFYKAFPDLLRVSKKYIIVSLPNNWKKALNEFIKGRGRWASYGLPPEEPQDRHRWFFNTEDAEDFIAYNSVPELGNYTVKKVSYHIPKTILRIKITHPILKFILPEHHFKNLFVETIFFCLEKKDK